MSDTIVPSTASVNEAHVNYALERINEIGCQKREAIFAGHEHVVAAHGLAKDVLARKARPLNRSKLLNNAFKAIESGETCLSLDEVFVVPGALRKEAERSDKDYAARKARRKELDALVQSTIDGLKLGVITPIDAIKAVESFDPTVVVEAKVKKAKKEKAAAAEGEQAPAATAEPATPPPAKAKKGVVKPADAKLVS